MCPIYHKVLLIKPSQCVSYTFPLSATSVPLTNSPTTSASKGSTTQTQSRRPLLFLSSLFTLTISDGWYFLLVWSGPWRFPSWHQSLRSLRLSSFLPFHEGLGHDEQRRDIGSRVRTGRTEGHGVRDFSVPWEVPRQRGVTTGVHKPLEFFMRGLPTKEMDLTRQRWKPTFETPFSEGVPCRVYTEGVAPEGTRSTYFNPEE